MRGRAYIFLLEIYWCNIQQLENDHRIQALSHELPMACRVVYKVSQNYSQLVLWRIGANKLVWPRAFWWRFLYNLWLVISSGTRTLSIESPTCRCGSALYMRHAVSLHFSCHIPPMPAISMNVLLNEPHMYLLLSLCLQMLKAVICNLRYLR